MNKSLGLALVALAVLLPGGNSQDAGPAPLQFLGILRLNEKYFAQSAWTEQANQAVGSHFKRLQDAAREGKVILAGRTLEANEKTIGLVIFQAADQKEAEVFMAADPAVVAGIMNAEVRPYKVAVSAK